MFFSPLWLLLTSVYGAFEEMENKLNLKLKKQVFQKAEEETEDDTAEDDTKNDTDDDAFKWINESKMIEVCTEASLQPILQLYLFMVSILSTKDLYSSCISLWTVVQVLSFASSLLMGTVSAPEGTRRSPCASAPDSFASSVHQEDSFSCFRIVQSLAIRGFQILVATVRRCSR